MRSQVSNTGQSSGPNDQKKSVFDRLGRQLDTGRSSMKRRPSPGQYGDYVPPPPPSGLHEADFGRYGPRDPHSQAELEWRYQNERRHMSGGGGPYPRDGRHPGQMQPGPPPPLPPPPPHYEIEMANGGRQPPYYPGPHPYHGGAHPGPPPGPMGPGNMSMSMHQQRSSPKYDRHGNLISGGFKERGPMRGLGPLDHHHGMSPSRSFLPPGGPMMHPGPPHEMQAGMRPPIGMYPPHRWRDTMEPDFQPPPPPPQMHPLGGRGGMVPEGRFSPVDSRRYQQMLNFQQSGQQRQNSTNSENPRYTKWRERRNVITNLDKETAQSSSRTDSLKSTLQQPDNRVVAKSGLQIDEMRHPRAMISSSSSKQEKTDAASRKDSGQRTSKESPMKQSSGKHSAKLKTEPQEISDGEIVDDDEDSSDESETTRGPNEIGKELQGNIYLNRAKNHLASYGDRNRESHQYYESNNKKRRLLERVDYSMDYETISDEDLDDFMGDKKVTDLSPKLTARLAGDSEGKSLSEIELLNALGLDWANLVEMAKQSKTSAGKDCYVPGSALPRFSITNYLPTLGITPELAGHELYELVLKVCHP